MAPRLKVFEWSDGLQVYTVATTSRPKALKAWGTRQDLFASGHAREMPDSPVSEIAKAKPDEIIERSLGVEVPDPVVWPKDQPVERSPEPEPEPEREREPEPKPKPKPKAKPKPKPKIPSAKALQKLADAQDALTALERSHDELLSEITRKQVELERKLTQAQRQHDARRKALLARIKSAKTALEK